MNITLLSDFGLQDHSVAVAKGLLLQKIPDARLIDISHEVTPFHLLECSYMLTGAFQHFAPHTIHICLLNLFEHIPARVLVTAIKGNYVICADNGLLPLTFGNDLGTVYAAEKIPTNYIEWINIAAALINSIQECGNKIPQNLMPYTLQSFPVKLHPTIKEDGVECQAMHIDRFENVVINLTRSQFEELRRGRKFRILVARHNAITEITEDYGAGIQGEPYARFNAAGYLEVSVHLGKAASLFGIQLHNERALVYQNIKIEFE